jgi:hypothetical protein
VPLRRVDSSPIRYSDGDRWMQLRPVDAGDARAVAELAIDRNLNSRPLEPVDPDGLVDVVVGLLIERLAVGWWRPDMPHADAYHALSHPDREWIADRVNDHIAATRPLEP